MSEAHFSYFNLKEELDPGGVKEEKQRVTVDDSQSRLPAPSARNLRVCARRTSKREETVVGFEAFRRLAFLRTVAGGGTEGVKKRGRGGVRGGKGDGDLESRK